MRRHRSIVVGAATYAILAAMLDANAASVSKSIDVDAPADRVWGVIGPFCAIKDWHPAIGACTENGDIRTLTTKDGGAQFVERRAGTSGLSYSYSIEKSPLPLSNYVATLKVVPRGKDGSTVVWSSTYTPDPGKELAADTAISRIYQAGLDNIHKLADR